MPFIGLDGFKGLVHGIKNTANGFDCRCPSHDDNAASLSVSTADDGRILVYCHAGCSAEKVVSGMGLSWSEMHPAKTKLKEVLAVYSYQDELGNELAQKVRYYPKTFAWRRQVDGQWVYKNADRKVLYRLPEVIAASVVYFVEGEKDADSLAAIGVCATSAPDGASSKWHKDYTAALAGKDLVIIPDNDGVGLAFALRVAKETGGKLKYVPAPHKDVSDMLAAGLTLDALQDLREANPVIDVPDENAPLRGLDKSAYSAVRILQDPASLRALELGPIAMNDMTGEFMAGDKVLSENPAGDLRIMIEQHITFSETDQPVKLKKDDVKDALFYIGNRNRRNPVREYLDSLPKNNGEHVIHRVATEVLGITDEFEIGILHRWFISLVARVYEPGCKVDHVLVLVGKQGVGKSTFFSAIAGKWFKDSHVDISNKDSYMVLHTSWIHEWSELSAMRKTDKEDIKAFITSQVDTYRRPYGYDAIDRPRKSVIVGTTNEDTFLQDDEDRRFWPIRISGTVDTDLMRKLRDSALAEAIALYREGVQYHPTDDERKILAERTKEFRHQDAWHSLLADHIDSQPVSVEWCLDKVGVKVEHWSDREKKRVIAILRQLGLKPSGRQRVDGKQRNMWTKAVAS